MVATPQCRDFPINTITYKFSTFFLNQADAYYSDIAFLVFGEWKEAQS